MSIDETGIQRYSRQLLTKHWGSKHQNALGNTSVAVSTDLPSAALYLAAAGVGRILLVGQKAPTLEAQIKGLNPSVQLSNCLEQQPTDWGIFSDYFTQQSTLNMCLAPSIIIVNVKEKDTSHLSLGCSAVSELIHRLRATL